MKNWQLKMYCKGRDLLESRRGVPGLIMVSMMMCFLSFVPHIGRGTDVVVAIFAMSSVSLIIGIFVLAFSGTKDMMARSNRRVGKLCCLASLVLSIVLIVIHLNNIWRFA